MDRYQLFQKLLNLVANDFEITNAKLKDYSGRICIEATCPDGDIKVEVTLTEKEEEDENAL